MEEAKGTEMISEVDCDEDQKETYALYESIKLRDFDESERETLQRLARVEEIQDNAGSLEDSDEFTKKGTERSEGNRIFLLDCKDGVTHATILSMFGVFFTNFAFSSYVFFILIFYLEDPASFNMTPEKALSTAAWLVFIGYPFNLLSSLISGYLFLKFGRRKVIFAGFMIGITAALAVPYCGTNIYPSMMILIALVNIGTAWTQNPPLIADYVRPSSIGKAYAIQGMLTFTATIFAVAVLFGSTKSMPFKWAILIVCPILYLMSIVSICGLKENKVRETKDLSTSEAQLAEKDTFSRTFCLQLRLLWSFSKADCVYNVSYLCNFVSEMGYLLSFVYINAWISQFFVN